MHHLETVTASAAVNMATDQLLLTRYPEPTQVRFRHYGWSEPAHTFGFAQNWGVELSELKESTQVIRRETGGGLVDHRSDWTWTLVLPPHHPASSEGLTCLYSKLHQALRDALVAQGIPAELQDVEPEALARGAFRACFLRAEKHDVVLPGGNKLAGAAQRRTRDGLLIQGYVDRLTLMQVDWASFEGDFVTILAKWLESKPQSTTLPQFKGQEFEAMVARFESEAWNLHRKRH